MQILMDSINFLLHIDTILSTIISTYGNLSYIILFAIIFAETGFVFTPFLPGDSLLFAAGAFAATGSFNISILILLLWLAAFLGDTANYYIGKFIGQKLIDSHKVNINQNYINRTQEFYKKHGGKTIFLARFIPIIRTFAPFIAGISKMNYAKFSLFNILGGLFWISMFTLSGYFFGNIPQVKENFSIVIVAIILISFIPILAEFLNKKNS
ncbi:MAG: DedA family protein [Candidatus Pacebacteria bacterium]|nr:DedA family protein [Candidatus Paceibacterota bacterium]